MLTPKAPYTKRVGVALGIVFNAVIVLVCARHRNPQRHGRTRDVSRSMICGRLRALHAHAYMGFFGGSSGFVQFGTVRLGSVVFVRFGSVCNTDVTGGPSSGVRETGGCCRRALVRSPRGCLLLGWGCQIARLLRHTNLTSSHCDEVSLGGRRRRLCPHTPVKRPARACHGRDSFWCGEVASSSSGPPPLGARGKGVMGAVCFCLFVFFYCTSRWRYVASPASVALREAMPWRSIPTVKEPRVTGAECAWRQPQ